MEQAPFKLLILAVIAIAVVLLFLTQFTPFFAWKEKPERVVKKQLKIAETQLGHFASQKTVFPAGYTVKALPFESSDRSIVFRCNSSLYCCPEGEKCEKAIEWDNTGKRRFFSFKESKPVTVSGRCRYKDLYICRVYIGNKPAQVDIKDLKLDAQDLDLAKNNKINAEFEVENTGDKDMTTVQAIARVYKIISKNELETKRELKKEYSTEFGLGKGEKHTGKLGIKIEENGKYEVEITFQEKEDETNYETKTFNVTAFGEAQAEQCTTGKMRVQELEKCVYLLPCKCNSLVECEKLWRNALNIPAEEKLELVSADEKKEEIILKYSADYKIPEWCDPKTMECKGYCIEEPPEPKCKALPCQEDKENCRVWLPCKCNQGAPFEKCIAAWEEKLGEKNYKKGLFNGKKALYIDGTIKRIPTSICTPCGGIVKNWSNCCELPQIETCGGNKCETAKPEPTPTPSPTPKPTPACTDGKPELLDCHNISVGCVQVFPCKCMSYEECKKAWSAKMKNEWNFNSLPTFKPYSYNGQEVPAVFGEDVTDCPECEAKYGNCRFGILTTSLCKDE